jgi:hypothetical protein
VSQGAIGNLSETQPTSSVRLTVKDYAAVALSFTTMFLKRLPDAMGTNPAKTVFGIAKIVLQIKDVRRCSSHRCLTDYAYQEVKGNIDAVDRRILSTADQLRVVQEALAGWEPSNAEERQGMKLFEMYACLSPLGLNCRVDDRVGL